MELIPRLGALKVIQDMAPTHWTDDETSTPVTNGRQLDVLKPREE